MKVLFLGPPTSDLVDFIRGRGDEVLVTEDKLELSELQRIKPDFLVSFGYRHIIKKEVIELFPRRIINLHISLLPWNRGADPNFWSIIEDTPKGVTIHYIDEGVDTGDIIVQEEVHFKKSETLRTSYEVLQAEITRLFKIHWDRIRGGTCIYVPQVGTGTTHKTKDKEQFQDLIEKLGYETPIATLKKIARLRRTKTLFDRAYIRCDSSSELGGGHVTRCLALAEILREKKICVEFICKKFPENMSSTIREAGYKVHLFDSKLDQIRDAQATLKIAGKARLPLAIVDNYALDSEWERIVSENHHLIVVDDLASRSHSCQMLINQNLLVRPEYKVTLDKMRETIILFGPQYAILRREFRKLPLDVYEASCRSGISVFFGNFDESGETLKFVKAILKTCPPQQFEIIVGAANKFLEQLKSLDLPANIKLHIQPKSVSKILLRTKLFFGSGGTITSERLACGLPGIIVSVADNQVSLSKNLVEIGCQQYLGERSSVKYEEALSICAQLYNDEDKLNEMSRIGKEVLSPLRFETIHRIADTVWIRPAQMRDARFLFDLRQDPAVASASIQQDSFSFKSHLEWVKRRIHKKGTNLYIVMFEGSPCGQVRIDDDMSVSISLSRRVRGKGVGRRALQLSLAADLLSRKIDGVSYKAFIRPNNKPSIRLFKSLGFIKNDRVKIQDSDFLYYTHSPVSSGQAAPYSG